MEQKNILKMRSVHSDSALDKGKAEAVAAATECTARDEFKNKKLEAVQVTDQSALDNYVRFSDVKECMDVIARHGSTIMSLQNKTEVLSQRMEILEKALSRHEYGR